MLAKLGFKKEVPVGNSIVWSMEFSQMVKCHLILPLGLVKIRTILSSMKLGLGNMFRGLYSWTLSVR
jgi:hypothetical protein